MSSANMNNLGTSWGPCRIKCAVDLNVLSSFVLPSLGRMGAFWRQLLPGFLCQEKLETESRGLSSKGGGAADNQQQGGTGMKISWNCFTESVFQGYRSLTSNVSMTLLVRHAQTGGGDKRGSHKKNWRRKKMTKYIECFMRSARGAVSVADVPLSLCQVSEL